MRGLVDLAALDKDGRTTAVVVMSLCGEGEEGTSLDVVSGGDWGAGSQGSEKRGKSGPKSPASSSSSSDKRAPAATPESVLPSENGE